MLWGERALLTPFAFPRSLTYTQDSSSLCTFWYILIRNVNIGRSREREREQFLHPKNSRKIDTFGMFKEREREWRGKCNEWWWNCKGVIWNNKKFQLIFFLTQHNTKKGLKLNFFATVFKIQLRYCAADADDDDKEGGIYDTSMR